MSAPNPAQRPSGQPSAKEPAPLATSPARPSLVGKVQTLRERYPYQEIALFFLLGFLFDIVTLDRIDNWANVLQQAVYLVLLGTLLAADQRYQLKVATPSGWWAKVWRFSEDAIHFLFGSLLSTYTLFFFKAASGLTGFAFLLAMFVLLVANELPRFRAMGPFVRLALYALCLTAFFAYVIPMVFGFLSIWLFLLAVIVASGPLYLLFRLYRKWSGSQVEALRRSAAPMMAMQLTLLLLYFAGAIPPIPLSVSFIGVYHKVERESGNYKLYHQRPDWKIWHTGDQTFLARPAEGDKIFVFVRIFAPTKFQDRLNVRWSYKDPKRGWVSHGAVPLSISGGRKEGFRTYANKSNYQPGDWKVQVETDDGREIGNIRFTVESDASTEPRAFKIQLG